ncbi:sulfotransferase [Salinisphaera sp.]|uniref:sulfotransferase n=1 Tax=Salinisphaera sp. TaxID=1914330 RepID=UPI002D773DCF|nr:sulfotransferase [Salinisphaera sp.]HET7314560.1 sulfotransferase [Salinisphaera sp.]
MTVRTVYYRWRRKIIETVYARLPTPELAQPVFILGCGRSGKSTLANLLSHYDEILYLNEPRHLWLSVFPQSDIWTVKAEARHGRMVLDADDFEPRRARRLRRLLRLQVIRQNRSILVEELAINSFRIDLIRRIFPRARFIHVYRDGLEVADLIGVAAERGNWFGANGYKWKQLVEYAERGACTRGLATMCENFRDMGLLEWRLSTEAVVSSLAGLPRESYLEFNSNELFDNSAQVLARVARFLGLEFRPRTDGRAQEEPRRSSKHRLPDISARDEALGGPMLRVSISQPDGLVPAKAAGATAVE